MADADATVPLAALHAGPGDPVVQVWVIGAHAPQPCYAEHARARTFFLDGLICEHVGEDAAGAWIYEQRKA